ncbi:hypothetical protein AU468_05800 [Alkalispirochaeta sphaeroplastigenens]|uniref:Uncharacterized protein n=1 Tax=Alkalispirochaeta sphaeroplastigenens TaxID=1187066 RepID=A0A2S4JU87_9SPIO|nr:hypothetical protein [Alkalispirochaeta sphaeroplastigenens]POR03068.1 hypothetical protein AU468_05800 [Alkalispirochaeta sphaeroplastigenens]
MSEKSKKIRLIETKEEILVTITDAAEELHFSGVLPRGDGEFPGSSGRCLLEPAREGDEMILRFSFQGGLGDSDGPRDRGQGPLKRFEAYIKDPLVTLRDEGFLLEGTLTGWVASVSARRVVK